MPAGFEVKLTNLIAPPFYTVHKEIKNQKYSEFWLKGGRGSTKSSFVAIEIVLDTLRDPDANAICFRKVGETLKDSVYVNILWAIDKMGLSSFFTAYKSPLQIIYNPTGQVIFFKGLDDPVKVKSIKTRKGYFKNIWFEELEEFDGMAEIRNVLQSLKRGGNHFNVFYSHNPPRDQNHWVTGVVHPPYRLVHESSFLQVPEEWLGPAFLEDAITLKEIDYTAYRHEYLGEPVGYDNTVVFFKKFEELDFETPEDITATQYGRFYYGADWGFAQDPTTLIRSFVDDNCLYIDHEAYGVGVEMDEIPQLFNSVPGAYRWPIYADNARPETISHMQKHGFNIRAAKKWKGSVEDGVEYLRKFRKIYIHPRCKHTLEEFRRYSYKQDRKTGDILPVIVDDYNHCIDAIRYAFHDMMNRVQLRVRSL